LSVADKNINPSLIALLPHLAAGFSSAPKGPHGFAVAGICGAQGSGKTTLAHLLEDALAERGVRALTLSLDDFYRTRAEREVLAQTVHPLCLTRGVPGTHDMALYAEVLAALGAAGPDDVTALPQFSKLDDDRLPPEQWRQYTGRPDIVMFEGWCVGARPQDENAWAGPINALERAEDPDGNWWRWWNAALARNYWPLWRDLSPLLLIRVPGMASVVASRLQQERGLAAEKPGMPRMDKAAVERFVAHYERLTLRIWDEMPARADYVLARDDSFAFSIEKPLG